MAEKEMRNFALRDEKGNEIGVFTGKSPRLGGGDMPLMIGQ